MRRLLLALLLLVALSTGSSAQPQGARIFEAYDGGYESITVATTAIGLTRATWAPAGAGFQAQSCSGRLETAQIRYRYDGAAPTSSEGELLEIGDRISIVGTVNISHFLAIRTGGTSGVLKLTCAK